MWQQNVSKLLSNTGWGSGFKLPIANDENLALERELDKKLRLLQDKQQELDDVTKHNEITERAIKNITQHIGEDRKLIAAKATEVAAERELLSLSEKDGDKLEQECKALQKAFQKTIRKNHELSVELESRKKDLEDLAELIEYDRHKLAIMEKRRMDEDQYLNAIEDLSEQDGETLRQYETRYRKATSETAMLRKDLDGKVAMTRVMQSQLDGLADRFRKLHGERGEVVKLWKETTQSLSGRDEEMTAIAQEYNGAVLAIKEKEFSLEAARGKLQAQSQSCSKASLHLDRWDRKVSELRSLIASSQELKKYANFEIHSYNSAISYASAEAKAVEGKLQGLSTEASACAEKTQTLEFEVSQLQQKLKESSEKLLSIGERVQKMNDLVEEEQGRLEALVKRMESEMVKKGNWQKKKGDLQNTYINMDHEIHAVENNLQRFTQKSKDLEIVLAKSHQKIYKIELYKINLELKYKPIISESPIKFMKDEGRIQVLKAELKVLLQKKDFLGGQIFELGVITSRYFQDRMNNRSEGEVLVTKSQELRNVCKIATKSLEKLLKESESTIIEQSLVRLKLAQLNKSVKQEKDSLWDSEQYRALLQASAKEKKLEVESHSRLLENKIRGIKDEVSQIRFQVVQVTSSIHKKKQRYEIIMKLMAKPIEYGKELNEDGSEKTEAYYILKMTQEREYLRLEGDRWDAKVKEAEKETEALQNSLAVIQCSNDLFKDSLKPIRDEVYLEELNKMKKEEKVGVIRKTKALSALHSLQTEVRDKEEAIEKALHQKDICENKVVDKEYELRVLQGELHNQGMSGRRARMVTAKLLQQITFSSPDEKELVSQDIRLRATRRKFEFSVQTLAKLLNLHPNLYEIAGKLLCQNFGETIAIKFLKRVEGGPGGITTAPPRHTPTSLSSASFSRKSQEWANNQQGLRQNQQQHMRTKAGRSNSSSSSGSNARK